MNIQILEPYGSIIYWTNKNKIIITCGKCKKNRKLMKHYVKSKLAMTKFDDKYTTPFNGYCVRCNHESPEYIAYKIKNRKKRKVNSLGYRKIYIPEHPMSDSNGEVLEHRLIMSKHIGRNLYRTEHVHHINHNRSDNRIENLTLLDGKIHLIVTLLENRIKLLEKFILNNKLKIPI